MEKTKIEKDSPTDNNRAAHLRPVIDFLIQQGNRPLQKDFSYDKSGIGTFEFSEPLNIRLLKERFDFPETIKVGEDPYYGGGGLWDERNGLKIHKG